MTNYAYALEQLFTDQDPDYVGGILPATLSWLDPSDTHSSCDYVLRELTPGGTTDHPVQLTWNKTILRQRHSGVMDEADRFRKGKTIYWEDQTKLAAYGLAFVAITCLLAQKVVWVSKWQPPDLLLDATPGAKRGVEVAGRGKNGYGAFKQTLLGQAATVKSRTARPGKRAKLAAVVGIAEGYISLWCLNPRVAWWEKAVP